MLPRYSSVKALCEAYNRQGFYEAHNGHIGVKNKQNAYDWYALDGSYLSFIGTTQKNKRSKYHKLT